jgi:hypothetical protein
MFIHCQKALNSRPFCVLLFLCIPAPCHPGPLFSGVWQGVAIYELGYGKNANRNANQEDRKRDKAFKLSDSGGLHLFVTTAGGKLWRLKHRFAGAEKLLSIGSYPAVGLLDAREARDSAKDALQAGRTPASSKDSTSSHRPGMPRTASAAKLVSAI